MKWPEEVMYRQEVDEYLAESVPGVIECSGISGDAYPTIIQFSAVILGNCKNLHSTACQLWQLALLQLSIRAPSFALPPLGVTCLHS